MVKIKSKTDVITNSSDETFLLRTSKSVKEVKDWLEKNIEKASNKKPAYANVVKITGQDVISKWLFDFEILYDSCDPDSVNKYKLLHCLNIAVDLRFDEDPEYDFVYRKYGLRVKNAFESYCKKNIKTIIDCLNNNTSFKYYYSDSNITEEDIFWDLYYKRNNCESETLWPDCCLYWNLDDDRSFLEGFCNYYEQLFPDEIPDWWKIPEVLDIQYWKDFIGFSTSSENSISWENIEKICEEFNGEHFHMG